VGDFATTYEGHSQQAMLPPREVWPFLFHDFSNAMSDTTKTQLIGFHAEPELANAVRKAAKRQERSVSEYMRRLLRRRMKAEARV